MRIKQNGNVGSQAALPQSTVLRNIVCAKVSLKDEIIEYAKEKNLGIDFSGWDEDEIRCFTAEMGREAGLSNEAALRLHAKIQGVLSRKEQNMA